jgi:hypothetical protein
MEPESQGQQPTERAAATQRSWATEVYWEDELMEFAVGSLPEGDRGEPWQDMERPLANSEF